MNDLRRRDVFELVTRTPDVKPIPCRWVFDRKRDKYGNVIRHRGRVVTKGFKQRFVIDFYEIFSPVIGYTTCLLYTSPSPRDQRGSRMPSSA